MHSNFPYQQRYQVFNYLNEYLIDLPHLNSIRLGWCALHGREYDSSSSLIMESDIEKNELIFRSS